jgi:hypothetical protein
MCGNLNPQMLKSNKGQAKQYKSTNNPDKYEDQNDFINGLCT